MICWVCKVGAGAEGLTAFGRATEDKRGGRRGRGGLAEESFDATGAKWSAEVRKGAEASGWVAASG